MKFHKLISRTIVATALLGATFGGVFSGISASAEKNHTVANGYQKKDSNNNYSQKTDGQNVSKSFTNNDTKVNITDGYLNLDSTPRFNFGNNKQAVESSGKDSSQNGNTLELNNSNDSLQVTDYRASSNKENHPTNWNLSVKVDPFQLSNSNQKENNNTHSREWEINFTNNNTSTSNFKNVKSDKNYDSTLFSRGVKSDGSDTEDLMKGGYGSTNINYNNEANKMAKLKVPYNVEPGNYNTNITWNLSTNISSEIN